MCLSNDKVNVIENNGRRKTYAGIFIEYLLYTKYCLGGLRRNIALSKRK